MLDTASGCSGASSKLNKHLSRQMSSPPLECSHAVGCSQPLEVAIIAQVWSLWCEGGRFVHQSTVGSTLEERPPSFTKGSIWMAGSGEGRGGFLLYGMGESVLSVIDSHGDRL